MGNKGVVYASGSKMIRRIIVPEDPNTLLQPDLISEGETMLIVDGEATMKEIEAKILADAAADGVSARIAEIPVLVCVVVNNDDKIDGFILADPAIDRFPNKLLVLKYSDEITSDCVYDRTTKLFTMPAHMIPGYIDRNTGEEVPPQLVPAKEISDPHEVTPA